jgi:fibronectin type 3 domain-containing protein
VTRALASLSLAGALALGCATSLDFGEMREKLAPRGPEPAPELQDDPNTALSRVEGLRALSGELRAIPLRWDASREPEVSGYIVERSPSADGPFVYIATLADRFQTVYVDHGRDLAPKRTAGFAGGGLAHADTYYYRVRPFDGEGRVGAAGASVVSGTTAAKPAPPAGVQAYSHLPQRVALRWLPAKDPHVTGYVVSRSPSPSGAYAELARLEGRHQTVFLDRELPDLGVFYYRVASIDAAGGIGDPSGAERAVTKGEPLQPTGLRIAAQTIGANTLVWDANVEPDLRGYRLLRKRAGKDDPEIVAELPASETRAPADAVAPGETVTYRVTAFDGDGLQSGPSDPVEIAGIAYAARAVASPAGVQLSWSPAAQAGFRETRILQGDDEVGRSTSASFLHATGKRGDRYRLIGIRPDGSEAPESKAIDAE